MMYDLLKRVSQLETEKQKEFIVNYECLDKSKVDIVEVQPFFSSSKDVLSNQIRTLLVNGPSKEALVTLFNTCKQYSKNHKRLVVVKCPDMSDYGQFYFATTEYHSMFGDNEFYIRIYNSALMQIDFFQLLEKDV